MRAMKSKLNNLFACWMLTMWGSFAAGSYNGTKNLAVNTLNGNRFCGYSGVVTVDGVQVGTQSIHSKFANEE